MWKAVVFSAIVCIFPKAVIADLTVVPRNTTVKIGDSAHLNCSTNLHPTTFLWTHGSHFVYTGESVVEPYNGRFKIETASQGVYNLVIQSVELSDAGNYICQDDGGHGQRGSAELIVIEKDPLCHPNITLVEAIGPNSCRLEPEHVHFACSLSYSGNVPPELEWKRLGENIPITEGVNRSISGNTATHTLTFKAIDLSNDNGSFICETKDATNLQYKCSTPVMKILYAFSDKVSVRKSVDEKIVCSANSSQTCSYNWKWFNDEKQVSVSNDRVLIPDRNGSYRCEAECQMRNKSCVVVPMIIEIFSDSFSTSSPNDSKSSSSSPSWMLFLIVIGVILLILIGAILVWFFIRRQRNLQTGNQKTLSANEKELTAESLLLTSNEANYKEEKEIETSNAHVTDETRAKPVTWNLSQGQEVKGLAISDDRIYVLTFNPMYVEMYDFDSHSMTGSRSLPDVVMFPYDIAYCKHYKRLYVMDGTKEGERKKIFLLDELFNLITSWKSSSDYGNLSVASDCSVILAAQNAIVEYSPEGEMIRRIAVHETVVPLCAIKIDAYTFIVSRGQRDGDVYEVCLIKIARQPSTGKEFQVEKIEKSFGNKAGPAFERLNNPQSLAESESKEVFVLDEKNNRVLKLNSDLVFKEEISLSEHGLQSPVKMCLSERSRGQLVVVGNSVEVKNSDSRIPGIGILVLPLSSKNQ